eukprot:TRINITY_DN26823_c0_g1_i1.p1 TRINITY_DN26823_c0_g1~~TRINITY_DN26823_c0_g1_i1.p1  ORF type:complete len:486 (-),score=73.86 TRINITY_DN26823_c0_g1_i1:48-1505(-)
MLQDAITESDAEMLRKIEAKKHHGITVVSDGFTDCAGRVIFNVLLVGVDTVWYYSNSDVSQKTKSMHFIAEFLEKTVKELPNNLQENVRHICLDGACAGAFKEIEEKLSVPCSICTAHSFDIVLVDLGSWTKASTKIAYSWLNGVMKDVVCFAAWAKARSSFLAMLATHSPLKLLCPNDTRFGTHFLCLQRLLRMKQAVRLAVTSDQFAEWKTGLKTASSRGTAQAWAEKMAGITFWDNAADAMKIAQVFFLELRVFDQGAAADDKHFTGTVEGVKEAFACTKEAIGKLEESSFLTPDRKAQVQELVESRWAYHRRPVHEAAAALNPRHRPSLDDHGKQGFEVCLGFFFATEDEMLAALMEHADWRSTAFEGLALKASEVWSSHAWWLQFGDRWPLLKKVGTSLPCQAASTGSAERGFSAYSDVKTKKRSQLSSEATDSLVRIYYNQRGLTSTSLVRQYWSTTEVFAEDADDDDDDEEAGPSNGQ